ncbi:MAG: hypothetical protein IPM29_19905 [Planctomycetes bacterium]|nr:hypothetical protein [Planctomycetota bacterium]
MPIHVPSLRERLDDVRHLARHFLLEAARRNGLEARTPHEDAVDWLRDCPWPGNVRELRNLCEAATILADESTGALTAADFQSVVAGSSRPRDGDCFALPTLAEFRNVTELEFIRRKIAENSGNIRRTAEWIGIQRSNLYEKLDRYGLK